MVRGMRDWPPTVRQVASGMPTTGNTRSSMEGFVRATKCIIIINFEQVMRRGSTYDDVTCDALVKTFSIPPL
jgi:hypothetical protein